MIIASFWTLGLKLANQFSATFLVIDGFYQQKIIRGLNKERANKRERTEDER